MRDFSSNRERHLWAWAPVVVVAMILVQGLRERSRGVEVGFALGVAAIAIIGFARGISAAERSHLVEYTVLALIVHEAPLERRDQGRRVPVPAVPAIVGMTLVGVVNECIQFFLPSRVIGRHSNSWACVPARAK